MDPATTAADFAQLSRDLMAESDERPTLQAVAERAVAVVSACDLCSVSLRGRRHRVETKAATSELAETCDALQYELQEGPCLEAVWDDDSYLAGDVAHDSRWPRWGPRVARLGIGSLLAVRLATETETIGALNLYSLTPHAFQREDVDLALVYTIHAGNALHSARLVTGLQTAVHSRHLIGVAQGILMSTYQLTMDQTFELLRRYASQANAKVHDIARYVVEHGGLPDAWPTARGPEAAGRRSEKPA